MPGTYQRFLIGERHLISLFDRAQGRSQSGCTDNGGYTNIARIAGGLANIGADMNTEWGEGVFYRRVMGWVANCYMGRAKFAGQCNQLVGIILRGEGSDAVALRLLGDHAEGGFTNRAGSAKDRYRACGVSWYRLMVCLLHIRFPNAAGCT